MIRLLRVWHGRGQNSRIGASGRHLSRLVAQIAHGLSDLHQRPPLVPPPLAFGQVVELDAFVGLLDGALFVLEAVFGLHGPQRLHFNAAANGRHESVAFEDRVGRRLDGLRRLEGFDGELPFVAIDETAEQAVH